MQNNDPAFIGTESPSEVQTEYQKRARSPRSGQFAPGTAPRQIAAVNSKCFVCGRHNPSGLHLTFEPGSEGVEAVWVPDDTSESFAGTVHGGIITSVLDEAMSKAIMACGWQAFTVSVKVRFHSRTSPGERVRVHGWIVERRKRRILTEASLFTDSAVERAHAWATFLIPGKGKGREPNA